MKINSCQCCGSEANYTVHPNYKGIGSHAVACNGCGLVMIGSTVAIGKGEVIEKWNKIGGIQNEKRSFIPKQG